MPIRHKIATVATLAYLKLAMSRVFGVGGRTGDKMIRLDLEVIKRNAPYNVVVLKIAQE